MNTIKDPAAVERFAMNALPYAENWKPGAPVCTEEEYEGFLAALGFAFFYILAAGAGLYYNTHRLLTGHVPNPWPWRIGSWIVCLALVSWLV